MCDHRTPIFVRRERMRAVSRIFQLQGGAGCHTWRARDQQRESRRASTAPIHITRMQVVQVFLRVERRQGDPRRSFPASRPAVSTQKAHTKKHTRRTHQHEADDLCHTYIKRTGAPQQQPSNPHNRHQENKPEPRPHIRMRKPIHTHAHGRQTYPTREGTLPTGHRAQAASKHTAAPAAVEVR